MSRLALRQRPTLDFNPERYARAMRGAAIEGTDLETEVRRLIDRYAGYADDDYKSSNVLPGESVYRTPDETKAHFMGLLERL